MRDLWYNDIVPYCTIIANRMANEILAILQEKQTLT